MEKCASHLPYLEEVGLNGYELQQRKLEAVTKRKAEMEAARARGEGTSTQVTETSAQEVEPRRSEIVPSTLQAQQGLRGLSSIVEEMRR